MCLAVPQRLEALEFAYRNTAFDCDFQRGGSGQQRVVASPPPPSPAFPDLHGFWRKKEEKTFEFGATYGRVERERLDRLSLAGGEE